MSKIIGKPLEEREKEMIKVNDEYLIAIDAYNFIARRKGEKKEIAFAGTLERALELIADDMVRNRLRKEAKTIQDSITIIREIKDDFQRLLKDSFPDVKVVSK